MQVYFESEKLIKQGNNEAYFHKPIDKYQRSGCFSACGRLYVVLNGYSCVAYQKRFRRTAATATTITTTEKLFEDLLIDEYRHRNFQ